MKQEYEKQDELKRSAMRAVAALLTIPDAGTLLNFIETSIDVITRVSHLMTSLFGLSSFS